LVKPVSVPPYVIKLYRTNYAPQDPNWSLGIYASGTKIYFDGPDAPLLRSGRKQPWNYERFELYSNEQAPTAPNQPTPTFVIATVVNEPTKDAFISFDNQVQVLTLKCHMLLLNGERQENGNGDSRTTIGIEMTLYRTPAMVGNTPQYVTFLGGGENGRIGSSQWTWTDKPIFPGGRQPPQDKKGDFPISQIDAKWFELKKPFEDLQKDPFGPQKLPGPLLLSAFDSDAKFDPSASLRIALVSADQNLAKVPTLGLVFRPGSACKPFPVPVNKRTSDANQFALPVLPEPGESPDGAVCTYRLVQRPSDDWLARRRLENGATEEWLIALQAPGFERIWNRARRQYDRALRTVRPVNRITLLPNVQGHPKTNIPQPPGEESFNVSAELLVRRKPGSTGPLAGPTDLIKDDFRVKPIGSLDAILCFNLGDTKGLKRDGTGQDPRTLYYKSELTGLPLNSQNKDTQDPFSFAFEATLSERTDADGTNNLNDASGVEVRIGALDLNFGGEPRNDPGTSPARFQLIELSGNWSNVPRLVGDMNLPILGVRPGGQDGLPASEYVPEGYNSTPSDSELCIDQRFTGSAPVVIPISDANAAPTGPFILEVHESNPEYYSETVNLLLHRTGVTGGSASGTSPSREARVIVIDSDPFLVAEVSYTPLAIAANSDVVALWSTGSIDGEAWQLQMNAQPFSLILPPQGIGEEMPKACELWKKDGGTQSGGPLGCGDQKLDDNDDLKALDFRFSPAARQELQASYTPQNFADAPWNLRRILGYPGQRDAGATVVQLNYELLYGLSCSVDTPLLRLAEILSVVGRIPGRVPRFDIPPRSDFPINAGSPGSKPSVLYEAKRWNWSLYAGLYSKRVAFLEPRSSGSNYGSTVGAAGASADPEVFTLSQGVQCTFRGGADLYYSVNPAEIGRVDDDTFPVPHPDTALKGGVSWPFESPRLFHATVRNPKSSSVVASGLALSPLGGTGTVKAGFDKDLSTITSITEVGRSSKISVARLGRIGAFHNLARYVIEYERDTSVSPQFKNSQTPFKHRPVLRKVREYVEILEPIAALSTSAQVYPGGGCVKSIEFKQRIIPVKGAWSANVGDNGWKIPLWYEPDSHVSDKNQFAYELPSIVFNMAGADGADVECAILSADKLFFYTETDAKADPDPHNWPIVSGVDFLPVPPPAPNPPFPSSAIHEIPAYDPSTPFGLAAFTHQLDPGHGRVNLVNGRSAQAIGANLVSVTLQRGPQVTPKLQRDIQQVRDLVRNDLFTAIRNNPANVLNVAQQICTQAKVLSQPVLAQVQALAGAAISRETALLQSYVNQAGQEINLLADEMKAQLHREHDIANKNISDAKAVILAVIQTEVRAFVQRLDGVPVSANALAQFAARVVEQVTYLQAQLNERRAELTKALDQAKIDTTHNVTELEASVQQLRLLLTGPIDRSNSLLTQVRTQVQSRAEVWMPGANLTCHIWENAISTRIASVQTILSQCDTLLAYANSGADNQIDGAVQAVQSAITAAQTDVQNLQFPDPNKPNELNFWNQVQVLAKLATALPDYLRDNLDEASASFVKAANGWIDQATSGITTVAQTDIDPIVNSIAQQFQDSFFNLSKDPLETIQADIQTNAQQIVNLLQQYANAISDEVCDAATALQNGAVNELEAARRTLEEGLGRFAESIAQALPPIDIELPAGSSLPVLLNGAFGSVPSIPNLGFSLPNAAYFFGQLAPNVNLTPVLTKVKDLIPNLSPLSTLVPSFSLSDRALPVPHLPNFDLNSIFPDFAGLKLDNLFPALKMPAGSNDAVKITHGLDNPSRTAWVQADIDLKTDTATIFSIGPMVLQIATPRFTSKVRAQADVNGQISKQASGSISGDWQLLIGGAPMITLTATSLNFDNDGKLHVDVSPDRVQLSAALSFIQQIIAEYSSPDSGFGIYPSATGIETRLALPIPDTSLGTTGISNLTFNFLFGLDWSSGFELYAGFGLASPNAPFNLTVYILGGGGHLVATARYIPGKSLTCQVDMAVDASAALSISLGPIRGSVHVNLGMRFIFNSGQGDLSLGIFLLIGGEVSILSIVSANILLRLDATYQNGSFTCRGLFSISIKICWCFTLSVSEEVSCRLGSGGGLAYNEMAPFPLGTYGSVVSDTFSSLPVSSIPSPTELAGYSDLAEKYLQLIS
jgi:hypothetical protein